MEREGETERDRERRGERERRREERERERGTERDREMGRERGEREGEREGGEKRRERETEWGGRRRRGRAQRELTLSLLLSCPPACSWPGEGQAGNRGGLGPLLLEGLWLLAGLRVGEGGSHAFGEWALGLLLEGPCPARRWGGRGAGVEVVGGVPLSGLPSFPAHGLG